MKTTIQYGVEITKPWSSEMYDLNEKIKENYKSKIVAFIEGLKTPEACNEVAKIVNPYGYGPGLNDNLEYMKSDMVKNVEYAESYWMKEIIEELLQDEAIEPMVYEPTGEAMNIIGFKN
jgi:hypothetical protein